MNQVRRWVPWATFGLGLYVVLDIIDQTILQPRAPVLGGYVLDWAMAGVVGATATLIIASRRGRRAAILPPQPDPARAPLGQRADAIAGHIGGLSESLAESLAEISQEAGQAMEQQGVDQQRALRRTILAAHRAQSLCDELSGLVAMPRAAAPPPSQEMLPPGVLPSWEESPG